MLKNRIKKCLYCSKEFQSVKGQKYCSKECRKNNYFEFRTCLYCGKQWFVYKVSGSRFCSNSCHTKSMAKPENKITRTCLHCGKQFITWKNCKQNHKFCSRECAQTISNNKSKWYKINDIMCQGTYELAFIDWCNQTQLKVIFDRRSIKYIDDSQKERNYHPDYWIPDWNSYVDIKSFYTQKLSVRKFELLHNQHPELSIKVLNDLDLKNLGVDLSYDNRSKLEQKHSVDKTCTITLNCDFCNKIFEKHYCSKATSCSKECAHNRICKKQNENFNLKKKKLQTINQQLCEKFKTLIYAEFALLLKTNDIKYSYEHFYAGMILKSGKWYYYRNSIFNLKTYNKKIIITNQNSSEGFIQLMNKFSEFIVLNYTQSRSVDELKKMLLSH